LSHPDFPNLPVAIDRAEGRLLQRVIADIKPEPRWKIGCAYGVSTLFICEALASLDQHARHIALDPFQSTQWRGIGREERARCGIRRSPRLSGAALGTGAAAARQEGVTIQFALIDGWHTFDQVMVEFYYLNRMLETGGVLVFGRRGSPVRESRQSVTRSRTHAYQVYGN
jgi:cephalosporin hydroxylase